VISPQDGSKAIDEVFQTILFGFEATCNQKVGHELAIDVPVHFRPSFQRNMGLWCALESTLIPYNIRCSISHFFGLPDLLPSHEIFRAIIISLYADDAGAL